MQKSPSLCDAIAELERVYERCAGLFRGVEMPRPVITVQSRGRIACLAWFAADRWKDGDASVCEINLAAETLARPTLEIGGSMVHEMAHYANWIRKVRDTTGNQYHNKHFRAAAESVGLICEKSNKGWATTTVGETLAGHLRGLSIDADAFRLFRLEPVKTAGRKSPLRKFACGCTNVWAKTDVTATCTGCGETFNSEGGDDDDEGEDDA
jgi:predicted SprT family Zn-dependent metalloprotease